MYSLRNKDEVKEYSTFQVKVELCKVLLETNGCPSSGVATSMVYS